MSSAASNLSKDELWEALVQTAHSLLMFKSHKRYVEENMLKEKPDISARELAIRLSIPLGEALVLLSETRGEGGQTTTAGEAVLKRDERSLLDYTK